MVISKAFLEAKKTSAYIFCSAVVRIMVSSGKGRAREAVVLPFRASMLGP
jgi:hypothetical protein